MPQQAPQALQDPRPAPARLFFALCPDEGVRSALQSASRNLIANSDGRPIAPEHYHITLAFLGSVPAALEEELAARAVEAAKEVPAHPFSFDLDELGFWASSQVIWYGCQRTPDTLREFALELRARLKAAMLPPHPGKFVPHVTLARWVRKPAALPPAPRIPWQAREVTLLRSETLTSGVRYTPLARCALGRQGSLI